MSLSGIKCRAHKPVREFYIQIIAMLVLVVDSQSIFGDTDITTVWKPGFSNLAKKGVSTYCKLSLTFLGYTLKNGADYLRID